MARLLILGGTAEGAALARALEDRPDLHVITSLAGRTRTPAALPGDLRTGGFGGPEGLADYLRDRSIDALIDATHPFAEHMSRNAAFAAERTSTPRLRLIRPAWEKRPGDDWTEVVDVAAAAAILPGRAGRVFVTSGQRDIAAFADLDEIWFLIRTIEPVGGRVPRHFLHLTAKGPFEEDDEVALLQKHRIDALVTKASGGAPTYAKIAASRKLGLPVIMIRRPEPPPGPLVHDTDAALTWLGQVTVQARRLGLRT